MIYGGGTMSLLADVGLKPERAEMKVIGVWHFRERLVNNLERWLELSLFQMSL